ncbi:MAG: exodeoxyribonuclease VII large subunit, partial [Verrucomicrobia bacterium]|nr:exodeoxyribonuclease VII large subunit [Verrucomicrobiota bacterium]
DGLKVQMLARPSLYEVNGRYQLIATEMEEAGKGSLQEQFEKLKTKLAAEGLFDELRKKPLPLLPRKIGVVTSPTGAAIRDIINVLTRRFPGLEILLVPAKVQGAGAEQGIAKAIDYLNTRGDIDVMIVGRGGGSIEDLWAFNEEVVARAIARSEVPVISAVGHEIDYTIADFVADVRAPTPSVAAELAVREKSDLKGEISLYERRLQQSLKTRVQDFRLRLNRAAHSYVFREPENLLLRHRRQIQSLEAQMGSQLRFGIRQAQQCIDELGMVMHHQMERKIGIDRQSLVRLRSQLRMLNPLAVLGRGYSLTRKPDGTVVRSSVDVDVGEKITTQLADGKVVSNVLEKE